MSKQHNPDEIRDYLVVEFPNEASDGDSVPLCVVPKVWVSLKHNICYWPKLKNENERRRAVIKKTQFEPDLCTPCPMVVRYKTNSYEKAMEKLKILERSEIFSSFSTHSEDEIKSTRKSKPNPLYREFQTCKSRQYSSQSTFQTRKQNSISSEDDLPSLSPPRMKAKTSRIIQSESGTEEQESTTKEKSQQPVVNSLCHSCENSEVKLDSAIRKLDLLSHDVKFLLQIVQRNAISEAIETPSDLVSPISGEEELQEFNRKLANDEDFFRNMTASLLCVGGKDIADATRRILNKLISHDLSLEYNWTVRGKKEFKGLKDVIKLILGHHQANKSIKLPMVFEFHHMYLHLNIMSIFSSVCLRKNPFTRNATDSEMSSVIKVWLRTAPDRHGGRNKRRTKAVEVAVEV